MPSPPEESRPELAVITPIRVVIGLCLFVPFVAMLWVSSYAGTEPVFIGMPFFYWYQMSWVIITTVLTTIAYKLVQRDAAQRRAHREEGPR